ncbi:MAG: DUF2306 domain-containing protein [Rhodobacteraceae bacterium]|nr:DUF2306 domain-containing protein [Paracoccaceae bacterium]
MTTLAPLLQAAPAVQFHAAAAMMSLALGPFALYRRRRDRVHKIVGYAWVGSMAMTAVSSFWLHTMPMIGPFGPIHALSAMTLVSLTLAIRAAICGNIRAHRGIMQSLWYFGLLLAAVFTLLPGRVMNRVLFGQDDPAGLAVVAGLLSAGAVAWLLTRRPGWRRNA